MHIFIIITYKEEFSQQIINYFKSLNPINHHQFNFFPVGIDNKNEDEIVKEINDKLEIVKNLESVVIFNDVGSPNKIAKRVKVDNPNVKVIKSNSSLIENGYLTFICLNTRAPLEVIEEVINKKIDKD